MENNRPKSRGILMKGPLVCMSYAGLKTETRRIVKENECVVTRATGDLVPMLDMNPYGMPGDLLYVRERWATPPFLDHVKPSLLDKNAPIKYMADDELNPAWIENDVPDVVVKNRPSIFLPRWASRMTLVIKSVHAERLQDMTDESALAEGVDRTNTSIKGYALKRFEDLWDKINGPRGHTWHSNPLVWVIKYEHHMINVDEYLERVKT